MSTSDSSSSGGPGEENTESNIIQFPAYSPLSLCPTVPERSKHTWDVRKSAMFRYCPPIGDHYHSTTLCAVCGESLGVNYFISRTDLLMINPLRLQSQVVEALDKIIRDNFIILELDP